MAFTRPAGIQMEEACPAHKGSAKRVFRGFEVQPKLALNAKIESAPAHDRRVRDEIRHFAAVLLSADVKTVTRPSSGL